MVEKNHRVDSSTAMNKLATLVKLSEKLPRRSINIYIITT